METLQPLKLLFFRHLGVNIAVEPHIISAKMSFISALPYLSVELEAL